MRDSPKPANLYCTHRRTLTRTKPSQSPTMVNRSTSSAPASPPLLPTSRICPPAALLVKSPRGRLAVARVWPSIRCAFSSLRTLDSWQLTLPSVIDNSWMPRQFTLTKAASARAGNAQSKSSQAGTGTFDLVPANVTLIDAPPAPPRPRIAHAQRVPTRPAGLRSTWPCARNVRRNPP